jgi:hypothetical protein
LVADSGWICHPSMVLTRQSEGSVIRRNGVRKKVFGKALWILCLVSSGYHHKGLVNVNDLSIDSSTVLPKRGRGKR